MALVEHEAFSLVFIFLYFICRWVIGSFVLKIFIQELKIYQ